MDLTIFPGIPAGTVTLPPSKSMAHRLLICAALAAGASRISNVALSRDIRATLDCLTGLGVDWSCENGTVTVRGTGLAGLHPRGPLPCHESGSTLRFLIPLCLLTGEEAVLTGTETLLSRPLEIYAALCRDRGLTFEQKRGSLTVRGPLKPGEFVLPGNVSSQFVTGLLLALPLLDGDSTITLLPPVESGSYLELTLEALTAFGVRVRRSEHGFLIPGGQRFQAGDHTVEGDLSNAAYLWALAREDGQALEFRGWPQSSKQGDLIFLEYFDALRWGTPTLSLRDCPDLGPVLFAQAADRRGAVFTHTRRLRLKESDRVAAMAAELEKFGCTLRVEENRVTVPGGGLHAPAVPLEGHNDHRIVMALSALCAKYGGTIRGAEAVEKSFPDFFTQLRGLGIRMEEHAHAMDQ